MANGNEPEPGHGSLQAPDTDIEDFEAAAKRTLEQHIRNSFIHTYKPVLDDAGYRSFDTMQQYREWCEKNLPEWLGYGRF
jgi:hypothetical protein